VERPQSAPVSGTSTSDFAVSGRLWPPISAGFDPVADLVTSTDFDPVGDFAAGGRVCYVAHLDRPTDFDPSTNFDPSTASTWSPARSARLA
jgi:hypothetical protein